VDPLKQFIKNKALNKPISEVLADIFRNKIIDGNLLPGTRLVEAELCKLYSVSRGSVREALRVLESEDLIEVEKHRSPTVKGVNIKKFSQMFEVRSVLEAYAANLAAQSIKKSGEDLRWAKKELIDWREHKFSNDVQEFIAQNRELHSRLLRIANLELLTAQVNSLTMPGYRSVLEPMLTQEQMDASSNQHAEILEAVVNGDGERAEAAMRHHIGQSRKRVVESFPAGFLDPRMSELKRLQGGGE
tara:strand:+ start:2555 stop:3289 length:735 start_codon:yes stop_codon:yes gene_type:complete